MLSSFHCNRKQSRSSYQRVAIACSKEGYPESEWLELSNCVRVIFWSHPDLALSDTVFRLGMCGGFLQRIEQPQPDRSIKSASVRHVVMSRAPKNASDISSGYKADSSGHNAYFLGFFLDIPDSVWLDMK